MSGTASSAIGEFAIGLSPIGGYAPSAPTGGNPGGIGLFKIGISPIDAPPFGTIFPSYLYTEYSDDPTLQAFVQAYNQYAQGYLYWANQTPLAIYTTAAVSGPLLDLVGTKLYGIERPVLSSQTTHMFAGRGSMSLGTYPLAGNQYTQSGTAIEASDDIYKRVLTWWLYKGDGPTLTIQWLKNRVVRFLNGANGADVLESDLLASAPSVTIASGAITITVTASTIATYLNQCLQNGVLSTPLQNPITITT